VSGTIRVDPHRPEAPGTIQGRSHQRTGPVSVSGSGVIALYCEATGLVWDNENIGQAGELHRNRRDEFSPIRCSYPLLSPVRSLEADSSTRTAAGTSSLPNRIGIGGVRILDADRELCRWIAGGGFLRGRWGTSTCRRKLRLPGSVVLPS